MTREEAYDGAWKINTQLSPRSYYAYAAQDDEDEWYIEVEQLKVWPNVTLHSPQAVQTFMEAALAN
ncbi:MAG: hypothetical protein ACXWQ5_00905 [Ktedonobacterales bacterium]